ncbi:hypothetical protein NX10_23890 [Pseudomonas fluorescens]|uniref:hypothetical protein n=1 Tax=Pseudomonas fluorescens TaxID=294 RepID=UPI00058533DE|nr:hypothetical protein [Pseudomonas fluorescens]KIF56324.1 hypothetical protein NX10_23890 [Pseudomonas fluorescens]
MSIVVILCALFFATPVVLGQLSRFKFWPKLWRWFVLHSIGVGSWSLLHWAVLIFAVATTVFLIFGAFAISGVKFQAAEVMWLFTFNCISSLFFLYYYWEIPKKWKGYEGSIKALVVPVVVVVGTLSKIYSDAGISELSGLAPQDLSGAQLWLTLIFTPVIWMLAISLGLGYASLILMPLILVRNLAYEHRCEKNLDQERDPARSLDLVAILAVFFSGVMSLTIMQKVVSKDFYEVPLREAIAFSAFHHRPTYCGLPDVKGVFIAPMSDNRAAVAIPDERLGYTFEPIDCSPKLKSREELSTIIKSLVTGANNGANLTLNPQK